MKVNQLSPQYDPKSVEKKWYERWLQLGIFSAATDSNRKKYCLMMPPPNVTGVLHMGHALSYTLEDILIRLKRMQGYNVLWLPGTDHAGIATQMVVEKNLIQEEKITRHSLGREKFLERVWAWKEHSQQTILDQLKKLGTSADWTRLRFTLDEMLSEAVREAFVRLFNDNLIVATTRPETMLGDTAVAVHPEDNRYRKFHGKSVFVPLIKRSVPIICDSYVDREFGTGVLKITPAHDPNDYSIGKKYGLPVLNIFDESAHINKAGGNYHGLSRETARKQILADLVQAGLLEKETPYVHNIGHCDRCTTVIEPSLSQQWFVKADILAKPAIEAVQSKKIRIIPEEWEKNYFDWMQNIRPWCISRQLWWGHRIPVWYCTDCTAVTAHTINPENCPKCKSARIHQDEDVLDTWFSSGLWPFSTLGWPKETPDLKRFYPTDVMETGFDILFFWVARMVMLGIKMTGQVPFHTVYLHPMVRDEYGQKMSKTKGNVKDPLEIIDTKGADALRFTLTAMAVHGRDVLLSDARIEGYRNFVNKLWNAARFLAMHFSELDKENVDRTNIINQWIWSRFNSTIKGVLLAWDQYRFFDAANDLYHFLWNDYCDWFLEFIKEDNELKNRKEKKESTAVQVLEGVLRLLHPIMPFMTEEIWQSLAIRSPEKSISLANYPVPDNSLDNIAAEKRVGRVISVIGAVRSKRGEVGLPPGADIRLFFKCGQSSQAELEAFVGFIRRLTKATSLRFVTEKPDLGQTVLISAQDTEIFIPREDLIDTSKEIARAKGELANFQGELQRANAKLKSSDFLEKAPQEVVRGVQARKQALEQKIITLQYYLEELSKN